MTYLDEILKSRRDTRHFTHDLVPDAILEKALQAGLWAPSVGLTDATKYYVIKSAAVEGETTKISLERIGRMPMPIDVLVEYADGSKEIF